jgi:hypothetical protein
VVHLLLVLFHESVTDCELLNGNVGLAGSLLQQSSEQSRLIVEVGQPVGPGLLTLLVPGLCFVEALNYFLHVPDSVTEVVHEDGEGSEGRVSHG